MNMKSLLSLMLIALFGAGLVACGGGSSSGGAGGGSGSSANLVVKVNGGTASFQSGGQATRVAAFISDFLIEQAKASAPEGHLVEVYDDGMVIASGVTDASGEVALAVPPNDPDESYFVCFDGAMPPDCPTVVVDDGMVVVATATQNGDSWQLTQENVVTAPEEDHLEAFQDADQAGNIIICHVPPGNPDAAHTLSIGQPAWQAHESHGDYLGPCTDNPQIVGEDDDSSDGSSDDDSSGRGPPDGVPGLGDGTSDDDSSAAA